MTSSATARNGAAGIANANKLGEMIYEELTRLPAFISTPPLYPSRELYDHVEASRLTDDWYRVIGGDQREGAIIVSQFDSAVNYSAMLSGRVANIVPVDSIDNVTEAVGDKLRLLNQETTDLGDQAVNTVELSEPRVLPIGDAFLYVQPIYVTAQGSGVTRVRLVTVYLNGRVGYGDTLREALRQARRPPT